MLRIAIVLQYFFGKLYKATKEPVLPKNRRIDGRKMSEFLQIMMNKRIGFFLLFSPIIWCSPLFSHSSSSLSSNDTEFFAITSLQAASLPVIKETMERLVFSSQRVHSISNLFLQQDGIQPTDPLLQLPNFGAKISWNKILAMLQESAQRKLLILIRHGEAWENLNPLSNDHCEFLYENQIIQNFDSPLSPRGIEQALELNELLHSPAPSDQNNNQNMTWYETIGLLDQQYFTSPLSRTLQTANYSLTGVPMQNITASELLRASVGTDVCNFRHSVYTSTSEHSLSSPWNTGCQLPSESLLSLYTCQEDSQSTSTACKYPILPFQFPIRPSSGHGIGLISDSDQLWRSDIVDSSHIVRSLAFLQELREYYPAEQVIGVITHGEMISAIYESLHEVPYSAKNTQIVPIMIEFDE